ncbi:MAG: hypothetical protein DRJ18_02355 [Candidatus Methanomethylicota archaeon]|nr:U6 snRNA-associated Sm-like protein LSm6 [Candidatus Culexmicrobium cathedralense]RLE48240.1 MAG: hypothetical protein DRJ18_02355 [Candidatus Verstraetearchaeota archaeon]
MRSQLPLRLLNRAVNSRVHVKLKSGHEYAGILERCDNCMNLILVEAEELNNGDPVARYGKILIRGNNILYIRLEMPIV